MLRVGSAADGAFMGVELAALLLTYALRLAAEVYGVGAGLMELYRLQQVAAAEDDEVQDSDERQQIHREARCKYAVDKERAVKIGKPFHLDRDNKEQKHRHIRIERREGEEHRQIDVCRRDVEADAGGEVDDKGVKLREYNAGEEKYRKLCASPVALKGVADEIIKIKGEQGEYAGAGRVEDYRDEPPDLTVHYRGGRKGEVAHKHGVDEAQ